MRVVIAAMVLCLSVVASGCGGAHCEDPALEALGVKECADSGVHFSYCACAVRHVFERYSCEDISGDDVPHAAVSEACAVCAPQYRLTCNF
jgi:hypothetical protein